MRNLYGRKLCTKKSRSGCLTAYLILLIIGQVLGIVGALSIVLLNKDHVPQEMLSLINNNPMTNYISILISVIGLIAAILIFMWKKWGVYLYVASIVINVVVTFLTNPSTSSVIYSLVGAVIGLGIFYFLIRNVYKHLT